MSNVSIDFLHGAGFAALLKDSSVQSLTEGHTNAVKQRADAYISGDSEGFKADVRMMASRPVGLVGTTDRATMIAASEQNALVKAVNG